MKHYLFLSILLLSVSAFASGDAHGTHGEIPTKTILFQSINVTIMFIGLIYFLRKPVKDYFKSKKELYLSFAEKALALRSAAESEHQEIHVKLTKLESTSEESISRARAEAADLKKQLIMEAQTISSRIKSEAENAAKVEIEKAKNMIRQELIKESVNMTRQQISTKVSEDDHKRLQGDFIDSIQAVQP